MSRISYRQSALKVLKKIDKNKKDYMIIHYSCESFINLNGMSPRISSIAIENLEYGQSTLFAIYKTAETLNYTNGEIQKHYPEIEKKMLTEYFEFLHINQNKIWLHWNMRDSIFGFKALEHRFEVLGGKPEKIDDSKQINIAALLQKLYGDEYVDNPQMYKLIELNDLHHRNFLTGKEEAKAFEDNKFYKLSMSSSSKVRTFAQIINLAIDNKLKTNTSKWHLYGDGLKAKWLSLKEKAYFAPISWGLSLLVAVIITHYVLKLLGWNY